MPEIATETARFASMAFCVLLRWIDVVAGQSPCWLRARYEPVQSSSSLCTNAGRAASLACVLAVEHALNESETGQSADLLSSRMVQHRVAKSESFSRLYTVKI